MSNKLKTLSPVQLEHFLQEKIDDYIGEACFYAVSEMSTPNIESEADLAHEDQRSIRFEVEISYIADE